MPLTLFPAFRSTVRSATHSWFMTLAGCGVLLLATACGSAATPAASSAGSNPSSAASAPAVVLGTGSPAANVSASKAAYNSCLRAHGAVLPTAKPTDRPTDKPTDKPTAKPTGTPGGHKGDNAIPAAARAACASLKPAGNPKKKTQA
jgi:hypothetical protein